MSINEPSQTKPGGVDGRPRPGLTIEHLWAILPVMFLTVASFGNQLRLLDFWWHLKAGQVIVETLSIPRVDSFSFTATGQAYVLQNWLSEIVYYSAYWVGGLPLLRTLNTLLLVGTLILILHLCWESTHSIRWSAAAATLALLPLIIYSSVRPQVFSFLLFAAFYWVLSGYQRGTRNRLWLLPVLIVLWVNIHGAFILGMALFAGYLGHELIYSKFRIRNSKIPRLAIYFTLTCTATLLNPEGGGVYKYILTVLQDPSSKRFVTEWQPPQITDLAGILCFFGPFFIAAIIFFYSRGLNLLELGIVLCFSIFGLTALRNGIWFALVVPPIVARHLVTIFPTESRSPRKETRVAPFVNLLIVTVMILIIVTVSPWVYPALSETPHWDPETPVAATDFIASRKLSGRIFHPQIYGDYMIWRLWPGHQTFVDGRVHLFGKTLIDDYFAIFSDSQWEQRLAKYDIQYLLLSRQDGPCKKLIPKVQDSTNWGVLYEDDRSILFEKVQHKS